MANSFQIILVLLLGWWPSICLVCLLDRSSTSWCETPHTTSPESQDPSLHLQGGRELDLDGSLGPSWLQIPAFLPLQLVSPSPRTSSHRCFSESRNNQGTAVCIPSGEKPGDHTCWPGFWLAESEPFNMETIRSVFCQVLGVAWDSPFPGAHRASDKVVLPAHFDKVVAGSHFQI